VERLRQRRPFRARADGRDDGGPRP
jgi:hypothetical protein